MMTGEMQKQIHKFLYDLSTENYNEADKTIKNIIKSKVDKTFIEEYEKCKKYSKKNK